jgi:hypothetical protein
MNKEICQVLAAAIYNFQDLVVVEDTVQEEAKAKAKAKAEAEEEKAVRF